MNITQIKNARLTGERAEFFAKNTKYTACRFEDGESPLKHSEGIVCEDCVFDWKYPLWYSKDIEVTGSEFTYTGRAGIWYTDNLRLENVTYKAPKGLRRCRGVIIKNTRFENAEETLWQCSSVKLENVYIKGDYFGMNCSDMEIDGLETDGNYCFDGAKNVRIKNSRLMSKDAFWNSEGIVLENCYISGEYFGWNSKDITLINCTVKSLQGFCYIQNLTLKSCKLPDTTLAFEYSTVDAEIIGAIESIKNPLGGRIRAESIGELILEPERVDVTKTVIKQYT